MVHYIPTTITVTAPEVATLIINYVVRYHGIPTSIISDRDTRFVSDFWNSLWTQLQTTLRMSTAYHPQTDGQTEKANKTIEEQLRHYVDYHQSNWDEYLFLCEIAYNSSVHLSTGYTPYYLNHGEEMHLPLTQALTTNQPTKNESALKLLNELNDKLTTAQQNIKAAQAKQVKYADQHRRDVKFNVGDLVMLSTANIKNDRPNTKIIS